MKCTLHIHFNVDVSYVLYKMHCKGIPVAYTREWNTIKLVMD